MRTSGINIKTSPYIGGFLRRIEALDERLSAERHSLQPHAHHVRTTRMALSTVQSQRTMCDWVKHEHGTNAVPVFHLSTRSYERATCLPGELGERIAS